MLRRSSRVTKGQGPKRYGCDEAGPQQLRVESGDVRDVDRASSRNSSSSSSRRATAERRKREAELEAAKRLAEIEKDIILKQLALDRALAAEAEDAGSEPDDDPLTMVEELKQQSPVEHRYDPKIRDVHGQGQKFHHGGSHQPQLQSSDVLVVSPRQESFLLPLSFNTQSDGPEGPHRQNRIQIERRNVTLDSSPARAQPTGKPVRSLLDDSEISTQSVTAGDLISFDDDQEQRRTHDVAQTNASIRTRVSVPASPLASVPLDPTKNAIVGWETDSDDGEIDDELISAASAPKTYSAPSRPLEPQLTRRAERPGVRLQSPGMTTPRSACTCRSPASVTVQSSFAIRDERDRPRARSPSAHVRTQRQNCQKENLLAAPRSSVSIQPVPSAVAENSGTQWPKSTNPGDSHLLNAAAPAFQPPQHSATYNASNVKAPQAQTAPPTVTALGMGAHHIKPLDLPKFSGKQSDYIQWRERFRRLVDEDTTTSEYYKLTRLRESLAGGSAEELIANILDGPGSYEAAFQEIKAWYGSDDRELERQEKELMAWKPIVSERDTEGLKKLALRLRNALVNMRVCGQSPGRELYRLVTQKVPASMLIRYFETHDDSSSDLATFADWLLSRVHTLRRVDERLAPAPSAAPKGPTVKPAANPTFRRPAHTTFATNDQKPGQSSLPVVTCKKCNGTHQLTQCPHFKKLDVRARWDFVKPLDVCICCLKCGTHRSTDCKANPCELCGRKHHQLLHTNKSAESKPASVALPEKPGPKTTTSARTEHTHQALQEDDSSSVSFMLVPVKLTHQNRTVVGTALLDPASSTSYVTEDVAASLRLSGELDTLTTSVLGGKTIRGQRQKVVVTASPAEDEGEDYSTTFSAWVLPEITGKLPTVNWNEKKVQWAHLNELTFPALQGPVVALIGLNAADLHVAHEERLGHSGEPIARRTPLGWVCFGPISAESSGSNSTFNAVVHPTSRPEGEIQLDDLVRNFWELEKPSTAGDYLTPAERQAEEKTSKSLQHDGERFTVGMPWVSADGPHLTSNRALAEQRFRSLERTLLKKPEVHQSYKEVIDGYLEKGYIEPVSDEQVSSQGSHQWYLPHFAVVREDRSTTKVRVVFDGSAQWDGQSLNGEMHAGRKTQNNIVHVLLRFCLEPIALCGDVSEMFLQIRVQESDRRYFQFLWRANEQQPVKVYRFNRVVFGAKASPYLAGRALEETARRFSANHTPEVLPIIQENFYVDDMLDSFPDVETASEARTAVAAVLKDGGFHIRKWLSNSEEVMQLIPPADRATAKSIHLREHDHSMLPSAKTLGVMWLPEEDVFTFTFPEQVDVNKITKRSVLRRMATIFDPRGQIAPFIIRSRILFQEACILGYGWDDEMDASQAKKWRAWFDELPALSSIKAPRCFKLDIDPSSAELQVHTFVDASDAAYAAVSYIRAVYPSGAVKTTLGLAKARPSPIRKLTIPKLELKAAVQGVWLSQEVEEALKLPISQHTFWSDSMNVLYWVHSHSRRFKTDIGTKISEIHAHTTGRQWRHVPGKINPADMPTRGMKATDLAQCDEWWTGPKFLQESEENWPKRDIIVPTQLVGENKKSMAFTFATATAADSSRLDPDRYSSWSRLVRVTSWCHRFIANLKAAAARSCARSTVSADEVPSSPVSLVTIPGTSKHIAVPELSATEIEQAEVHWIAQAQRDVYSQTINTLKNNKALANGDPLRKLNPGFSTQHNLLVVQGRLDASELSQSVKRPVILPQKHRVTDLIIAAEDAKLHHEFGVNYLWSNLAEKYWIIHAKSAIKKVRHNCNACRRRWNGPMTQQMGQLPALRVENSQMAFSNVGIDYAGPFETRQGRGKVRTKRYLCVFTCLETRACHLEMAYSLNTDGFLQCFSRFQKRRGTPKTIVSDNGSNFVAAERELREAVEKLDNSQVAATMSTQKIHWRFNPPSAPHHGGVFEAVVKSAKRAIHGILRNAACTDEELLTAIVEAEHLLNSRPITVISADSNDPTPLTPYHFLIGRAVVAVASEVVADLEERVHPGKRWQVIQRLVRDIWQRWKKELVPLLNIRQKWWKVGRDLKVGEVVLYMEPQTPRAVWPLARVVATHPGPDGRVRVVDISVKGRVYRRPITVLVPLEDEPVNDDAA